MTKMFTILKKTNSVITIFIQPDERYGEPEHNEPGHAGDDEHEQWHAGIISFVLKQRHLKFWWNILRSHVANKKAFF